MAQQKPVKTTKKKSINPANSYPDKKDKRGFPLIGGGEGKVPSGPTTGRRKTTMGSAKNGKSFPDLNKDGKITKADILKGRGVIAKKGATVMKAQKGKKVKKTTTVTNPISKKLKINPKAKVELANPLMPPKYSPGFDIKAKTGTKMKKCKYGCK